MGNQRVGIFPPKSKILFVLSLALIWCRNIQYRTFLVGGDTWTSCLAERRRKRIIGKKNEIYICEAVCDAVREWSEVTRPTADCQTTFFRRFKQFVKILKNVAERSRDSGRRSRDRRPTVKQRFLDVSSDLGKFEKVAERSRDNGWGHVTVGRLSNNVFSTFQAIRKFFEKSCWTVTRQWSEVTRPSADCQTTFFGRFKRFGKILIKVAERSRDSGWGHATVGRLSNNVFWTFQAIRNFFEKSRWTVTRQWSEVTRPSADCQTSFFRRFKQFGKIL